MMAVYVIAGLAAGLSVGAVGFADAVFANAIFAICFGALGGDTTLAIVAGGSVIYPINLVAIRKHHNLISWGRRSTFWWLTVCGLFAVVPATIWLVPVLGAHLAIVNVVLAIILLSVCGYNLIGKPITISETAATRSTVAIGLLSGVLGAVAGLSGVFTTLWVKARDTWGQPEARGVYQPFVAVMHVTVLVLLVASSQVPQNPSCIIAYVSVSVIGAICSMIAVTTEMVSAKAIERILPPFVNVIGVIAAVNLFHNSMITAG